MQAGHLLRARAAANPTRRASRGRGARSLPGPRSGEEWALRVLGFLRNAVRRPFSRSGCCFWLWAARGRPDCGSAGKGWYPGRPTLSGAGWPSAAGLRDCGELRRFSRVPCQHRSAVQRLGDPRKGGGGGVRRARGVPALLRVCGRLSCGRSALWGSQDCRPQPRS